MKSVRRILAVRYLPLMLAVVLWAIGLVLNADWRWYGGIAWALVSGYGMYTFGLWLAGPHVLPIAPDRESRRYARRMMVRFGFGWKPVVAVVREGKVLPGPDGKPRDGVQGEGAIVVDSTSVVALVTDTGLSRIKGPGVHFLRKGEKIGIVVDLRPQVRSQDKDKYIEAQTRDGIWVKFNVTAHFQIDGVQAKKVQDADRSKVRWPEPYTWSQHTVRQVIGHTRVGPDPNQTVQWDALVLNEAIKLIRTVIAGFKFDELIEPRDPRVNPRDEIRKKLEDDVRKAMAGSGIKVLEVRLSQFVPRDKEVDLQRIEAWKADWARRRRIIEAEGQAERYRLIELARAQGQMELVMRIAQALEATQPVGTGNADLIALRLLEVVERLAAQPDVGPRLSLEAREALSASRRRLGKGLPGDVAAST